MSAAHRQRVWRLRHRKKKAALNRAYYSEHRDELKRRRLTRD